MIVSEDIPVITLPMPDAASMVRILTSIRPTPLKPDQVLALKSVLAAAQEKGSAPVAFVLGVPAP